jgi:hypothetical protein
VKFAILLWSFEHHDAVAVIIETCTVIELEVTFVQRTYKRPSVIMIGDEKRSTGPT